MNCRNVVKAFFNRKHSQSDDSMLAQHIQLAGAVFLGAFLGVFLSGVYALVNGLA